MNYEELIKVIDLDWSAESLKSIRAAHGDPLNDTSENVVYFCEENKERQSIISKKILNRHPELTEGQKINCNGGGYTKIKQQTTYETKDGDLTKEKNVIAFFYDPTKHENQAQHDIFQLCQELRKISENFEKKDLTVLAPQVIKSENMKKILAATFYQTEMRLFLGMKKKNFDYIERKKNADDDKIIVIDEVSSYADTVKKLKEGLKDSDTLEQIKGVSKTNSGKVIVRVSESANKDKVIKRLVESCKVAVHNKMKRKFLHIKDLDATAEIDDIKEAILKTNLVKYREQLEVKALRPMKNGNQIATIWMEESDSIKIVDIKKLRVGLNICQLQERIEILRCYRCWAYDHRAAQCDGEDRSQKCRKCTGDSHKAKDCKEEPYCPHCMERGHAAGSSSCRVFQESLRRARREKGRQNKNIPHS